MGSSARGGLACHASGRVRAQIDDKEAGDQHGDRVDGADGERADIEGVPEVRLAEELLGDRAGERVADEEGAGDEAGPLQRAEVMRQYAQDDEQQQAFHRRLVELARMARRRLDGGVVQARLGEHHAPGQGRRPAEQLAVDEVGDAAEKQPDRNGGGAQVCGAPRVDAVAPREDPDGDAAADERAVEGHAALPHRDDVLRVGEIVAGLIEDDEAEAAAQHDAGGDIEEKVVDLCRIEWRVVAGPERRLLQQAAYVEPAEEKT